jgi:hypothetical protein
MLETVQAAQGARPMEMLLTTNLVLAALLIIGGVLTIKLGVKIVPQSKVYVV